MVYRYQKQERETPKQKGNLSKYFGIMDLGDGLAIQIDFVADTTLELAVPLVTADKGSQKITELDLRLLEP